MHIVLVNIQVKPEHIEDFKRATLLNVQNSLKEKGIHHFDLLQRADDPNRFILLEVYQTPDDQQKHRETSHYQVWKEAVADMMAEPRQGVKYVNLYPDDKVWEK